MRVERTLASFRLAIAASTLLAACGLTIGASEARAQGARVAPTACSDLKSFGVANTAIAMAETVAAGTFRSPTPGTFTCRVVPNLAWAMGTIA